MGFGDGRQSETSTARLNSVAKRKAEIESVEQLCERQALEISNLRHQLDEAREQRNPAIQQHVEAQAKQHEEGLHLVRSIFLNASIARSTNSFFLLFILLRQAVNGASQYALLLSNLIPWSASQQPKSPIKSLEILRKAVL